MFISVSGNVSVTGLHSSLCRRPRLRILWVAHDLPKRRVEVRLRLKLETLWWTLQGHGWPHIFRLEITDSLEVAEMMEAERDGSKYHICGFDGRVCISCLGTSSGWRIDVLHTTGPPSRESSLHCCGHNPTPPFPVPPLWRPVPLHGPDGRPGASTPLDGSCLEQVRGCTWIPLPLGFCLLPTQASIPMVPWSLYQARMSGTCCLRIHPLEAEMTLCVPLEAWPHSEGLGSHVLQATQWKGGVPCREGWLPSDEEWWWDHGKQTDLNNLGSESRWAWCYHLGPLLQKKRKPSHLIPALGSQFKELQCSLCSQFLTST